MDIQELRKLEESLWVPETRFDKAYMDLIFADDFFEFGRSGRTYTRPQCLDVEEQPINIKLPLDQFKIRNLSETIFQVTYVSEVMYETLEKSNRCSLWAKTNDGWKLLFHQGTPTK